MGGILLNAAVGAMLWRPVEPTGLQGRRGASRGMSVGTRHPATTQGSAAPVAGDSTLTPLILDHATSNGVLPEVSQQAITASVFENSGHRRGREKIS